MEVEPYGDPTDMLTPSDESVESGDDENCEELLDFIVPGDDTQSQSQSQQREDPFTFFQAERLTHYHTHNCLRALSIERGLYIELCSLVQQPEMKGNATGLTLGRQRENARNTTNTVFWTLYEFLQANRRHMRNAHIHVDIAADEEMGGDSRERQLAYLRNLIDCKLLLEKNATSNKTRTSR